VSAKRAIFSPSSIAGLDRLTGIFQPLFREIACQKQQSSLETEMMGECSFAEAFCVSLWY